MMKTCAIVLALLALSCVVLGGVEAEEKVYVKIFKEENFQDYSQTIKSNGSCVDMNYEWINGNSHGIYAQHTECAPLSIQFYYGSCVELYTDKGCTGTKYLATNTCCARNDRPNKERPVLYNTATNDLEIVPAELCIKSAKACSSN